jgi:hypothetical protein
MELLNELTAVHWAILDFVKELRSDESSPRRKQDSREPNESLANKYRFFMKDLEILRPRPPAGIFRWLSGRPVPAENELK